MAINTYIHTYTLIKTHIISINLYIYDLWFTLDIVHLWACAWRPHVQNTCWPCAEVFMTNQFLPIVGHGQHRISSVCNLFDETTAAWEDRELMIKKFSCIIRIQTEQLSEQLLSIYMPIKILKLSSNYTHMWKRTTIWSSDIQLVRKSFLYNALKMPITLFRILHRVDRAVDLCTWCTSANESIISYSWVKVQEVCKFLTRLEVKT